MSNQASDIKKTHCCYCSMQCEIDLVPDDGPIGLKAVPSKDFPVATGRLCQKGIHSLEHVFHEERILQPLRRKGAAIRLAARPYAEASCGDPAWADASWEEALAAIASEIMRLQELYGKDAAAVYGGGSLSNEVCYLLGKFARVALGTKYIDYNGRYCMSSSATAMNLAFGIDRGLPFPLSDIPEAKYLILAGTNIAECQPTMMPYILQAKKNGAIVVTIDPRNTMTSKSADIHVRLQPGFDSVFVNGLLHVLIEENLVDEAFIHNRTTGYEALKAAVEPYTPDVVERFTGVLAAMTRSIARGFAKAETGMVLTARGLEQQINGVDNALNYINMCLLTGKIGRIGSGYGSVTGQANGQGGREHGLKADQLPGYRSIEDPAARRHIADVWGLSPEELPGKGVSAYEMFEKILDGEIKALLVFGSNPVVSSPNNRKLRAALGKLDMLVVADMFETETAQYADWLLPIRSFAETEGTFTNLEGRVFHRGKAIEPIGGKSDIEILCRLAEKLGKGRYFPFDGPRSVFAELALASRGGRADYSGMSYERITAEKGLFWPCPAENHPGTPRLFTDGFAHDGGKVRLHAIHPDYPAERTDADFPYLLTTGRLGNHYLSGAQTRRSVHLMKRAPLPVAEIHPSLARELHFRHSGLLRLTSRRGTADFQVKTTEGIHPKTIFVPFHWGGAQSVNQLTHDALDARSRMPEFKICAVRAECVLPDE